MSLTSRQKVGLGIGAAIATLLALLGLGKSAGAASLPGTPIPGGGGGSPEPDPGGPGVGGLATSGAPVKPEPATPDMPGVSFDPGQHEGSYPTPGKMYQVKKGDIFGGEYSNRSIAYRALLSVAYVAARKDGMSDDDAKAFARSVAKDGNKRAQYIDAITCAGINDAAYATWGYGPKARPGPQGRAIRLLKYHARNRDRLIAGNGFVRNIKLGSYMSPGDESGTPMDPELADEYEYLFLPDLDHERLLAGEIFVNQWNPPFDWTIDMPEDMVGQVFGCDGGEILLS